MKPEDIQKMGSFLGGSSYDSSPGSTSSSSGSGGGSTYPTEVPSTDPFPSFGSPDATMPGGPVLDPLMSLKPDSAGKVMSACSDQLDGYYTAMVYAHDTAYYQAVRDLYDCSAGVVPAYTPCLPLIDTAWASRRAEDDAAMAACLNGVTG